MAEYDLISNVKPDAGLPVHAPLRIASDIPSEQRVIRSALSLDLSRLELSVMGLEEANLVFSVDARSIGHVRHDAKMIPNCSLIILLQSFGGSIQFGACSGHSNKH